MMKFSVLVPTRNRLEYLRQALPSITRQEYDNWEIIVSDNCSDDGTAEYVASFHDDRIKYHRTRTFVSATDNWNNALDKSTGDFVVMIGDDDALLKGYFSLLAGAISEFRSPDLIYTGALLYAHPGVMPGHPGGYLANHGWASFLREADGPHWLRPGESKRLVELAMNFQIRADFNMQFAVISRSLIRNICLRGPFFQGPFPDYYGMNAMFLEAGRILAYPVPLVVIGVTPKSHGFYVFNGLDKGAGAFLNNASDPEVAERLRRVMLPGTHINSGWLVTMEVLSKNYGKQFGLRPNYTRYRLLQFLHIYGSYLEGKTSNRKLANCVSSLRFWERAAYAAMLTLTAPFQQGRRLWLNRRLVPLLRQFPAWSPEHVRRRYRDILEVVDDIDPLQAAKRIPGVRFAPQAANSPALASSRTLQPLVDAPDRFVDV